MTDIFSAKDYTYDVAFSFLGEDESLAEQLNRLVSDRLRTFIYTRQQEQVAGTDGEQTLNRIFGTEARIVVVLYRSRWGDTPFTRVEETAIRNRAYDDGFDFTVFVPLEDAIVPPWLPKPRIWPNLSRWGVEGLAAVIEARVQESGGESRDENARDRAVRLHTEIEADRDRRTFLNSANAVRAAQEHVKELISVLRGLIGEICQSSPTLSASIEDGDAWIVIRAIGGTVKLNGANYYGNTRNQNGLTMELYDGFVPGPNHHWTGKRAERLDASEFAFDQGPSGDLGWRDKESGRFYTNAQLSDYCAKLWLDQIRASYFSE